MALNRELISKEKSAAGDLYRAIEKQRPEQYQGVYVIDPDGKVLSNQPNKPANEKDWDQDLLRVIQSGVKAYGKVTRRPAGKFTALADRGVGKRKDGSLVLAVYLRPLALGLDSSGFGPPAYDSIVLTPTHLASLALAESKAGTTWSVPAGVVGKFHKLLSPSSDPNTMARADEVTRAGLEGKVERVRKGIAYLSFTGRIAGTHVWEFEPNKGKKIHAAMKLTGVGTCDTKTGELLSITLVGDGTYRNIPPYDEKSPYGAVVEWKAKK